MAEGDQRAAFIGSVVIAVYVYYMLNKFETSCSIHHPLEIHIQGMTISEFLKHPVYVSSYGSKVCPLGNLCGLLMAAFLVLRHVLPPERLYRISVVLWVLLMTGSLLMNLNVVCYLIPAILLDVGIILPLAHRKS